MRSEAIAEIKRGTGYRATQEPTIIAALQQAQRELETGRTLPKMLLKTATLAYTASGSIVTLPVDFLRFSGNYPIHYRNSDNAVIELPILSADEAIRKFDTLVASGETPKYVSFTLPDVLRLWPPRS